MNHFIPTRARHGTRKEHWQFILLGLATIYEGLVMTLSLGYLNTDTRAWLLFDFFDDSTPAVMHYDKKDLQAD